MKFKHFITIDPETIEQLACLFASHSNDKIERKLDQILCLLRLPPLPPNQEKIRATVRFGGTEIQFNLDGDIKLMYIVKNDHPDVSYTLDFEVTDAEGEVLPDDAVDTEVTSTDVAVVNVDASNRSVSFGHSGVAAIAVAVKRKTTGELLGSFGAQFTVTTGDPNAISGGSIVFEGLNAEPDPVPEPTPEPPVEEPPVTEPNPEEPIV